MRHIALGIALAAVSTGAQGQTSAWNVYEPETKGDFKPVQAFVQAADGSQLILKCDKPGPSATYAVIVSKTQLSATGNRSFESRPVTLRFDDGGSISDAWRFSGVFASAVDNRTQQTMTHFVTKLAAASKFEVRLEPIQANAVEVTFPVAGAKEAIAQVYASCKDKNPIG